MIFNFDYAEESATTKTTPIQLQDSKINSLKMQGHSVALMKLFFDKPALGDAGINLKISTADAKL